MSGPKGIRQGQGQNESPMHMPPTKGVGKGLFSRIGAFKEKAAEKFTQLRSMIRKGEEGSSPKISSSDRKITVLKDEANENRAQAISTKEKAKALAEQAKAAFDSKNPASQSKKPIATESQKAIGPSSEKRALENLKKSLDALAEYVGKAGVKPANLDTQETVEPKNEDAQKAIDKLKNIYKNLNIKNYREKVTNLFGAILQIKLEDKLTATDLKEIDSLEDQVGAELEKLSTSLEKRK